jgi:hypothetical protein
MLFTLLSWVEKIKMAFFYDEAGKVIKDKIPKMPSFTNYFWVVDW